MTSFQLSPDQIDSIVDTALSLASKGKWEDVTLGDVSDVTKIPMPEIVNAVGTKFGILSLYLRRLDAETLANLDHDTTDASIRERIFDTLLCRLDAMDVHKTAIDSIIRATLQDPLVTWHSAQLLGRSLTYMLEVSGVSSSGISGFSRISGLGIIYLRTLQIWLTDDSADMSKTMAELDKRLRQAESAIRWLNEKCHRQQNNYISQNLPS